jgi:hypothetical protein
MLCRAMPNTTRAGFISRYGNQSQHSHRCSHSIMSAQWGKDSPRRNGLVPQVWRYVLTCMNRSLGRYTVYANHLSCALDSTMYLINALQALFIHVNGVVCLVVTSKVDSESALLLTPSTIITGRTALYPLNAAHTAKPEPGFGGTLPFCHLVTRFYHRKMHPIRLELPPCGYIDKY